MRAACSLLTAAALSLTGCTAITMNRGTDPTTLRTREDVHRAFGPPLRTGESGGRTYDEYQSREKIADPLAGQGLDEAAGDDLGKIVLWDAMWFPVYTLAELHRLVVNRPTRFTYDGGGNVVGIRYDGGDLHLYLQPAPDAPPVIPWGRREPNP